MRYVQLRAFHNVAIHSGFSRAADALSLTQPALSDQVRKLEIAYDVLLFDRHKKGAVLTKLGHKLLEITHRMFEVEQQAQELLSESRQLRDGELRIIADSPHHFLHILAPFRQKYPNISITLSTGNTGEIVRKLTDYEADIGVLGKVPENREFVHVKLGSTPIIAFASRQFPLPSKKPLTLQEITSLPLVMREYGSKTRQILEDIAKTQGFSLNAQIEVEGREAVREIVASSAGIGFVSEAEFGYDSRLVQIPIAGKTIWMDEALICLKERSNGRLINAFMNIARET